MQKFTNLVFNCSTHLVSWKLGWPFELLSVLPEVLEFGTTRHRWAAGVGTFLANGPVDQVDSVNRTSFLPTHLFFRTTACNSGLRTDLQKFCHEAHFLLKKVKKK